jgi:hypothetical protein
VQDGGGAETRRHGGERASVEMRCGDMEGRGRGEDGLDVTFGIGVSSHRVVCSALMAVIDFVDFIVRCRVPCT